MSIPVAMNAMNIIGWDGTMSSPAKWFIMTRRANNVHDIQFCSGSRYLIHDRTLWSFKTFVSELKQNRILVAPSVYL